MFSLPLNRRAFLKRAAALGGTGLLPWHAASAAEPDLAFLVVGDWGKPGIGERRVAQAMEWCARNSSCRFVISVGDNFYGKGVTSVDDPQWQTTFEDVFSGEALQVPWYAVLGNHDYIGNPTAQIDYSKQHPRWHMPAHYYLHREILADGEPVDFFFIDTNLLWQPNEAQEIAGVDPTAQLAWLETALAQSTARWKLVVGHHPVFSGGERHGDTTGLIVQLKPLLDRYGVQVYFNGHDHNLQHIIIDGIHFITSGAGSEVRQTGQRAGLIFAADRLGFVEARFRSRGLTIEFIDSDGASLHSTEIAIS